LRDAGVVRLAEPEHGFLARFGILVRLGDRDELVDRAALVALREGEDQGVLEIGVLDPAVETDHLVERRAALAGPEDRLLPRVHGLRGVGGDAEQPVAGVGVVMLGDREDDLFLQVLALLPPELLAEPRLIVGLAGLAKPEDRFLPEILRLVLVAGEIAQHR